MAAPIYTKPPLELNRAERMQLVQAFRDAVRRDDDGTELDAEDRAACSALVRLLKALDRLDARISEMPVRHG